MPGPIGIAANGNLPQFIPQPQVANPPGNVGNVGGARPNGGAPNVAPQARPPQEPARAADVIGKLDVLMLRALKSASGGADAKGVEDAAKSAGLPKALVKELKNLATAAQNSLKELDKFSGAQLAQAMVKMEKDGRLADDWRPGSKEGEAFHKAQEAMRDLSVKLQFALPEAKDGQTQAALEELMLQCDRRAGELETLVIQMSEIIDAGGDNASNDAARLAGGNSISSYTSADGNADAEGDTRPVWHRDR